MYIEIDSLTKIIGGQKVLQDINLQLKKGVIYGIKGKNGSGKTMLLRSICGLIKPTEGTVKIDGKLLGKDLTFPHSVGVLIENPGFIVNLSGYDNLKMLADIKGEIGKTEIEEVMEQVGLNRNDFRKKYKTYSLGMKQKLGIAAAVMEHPDLILLDEPTNALDEESVNRVIALLKKEKERGALIIIASHDLEELNYLSDTILVMEEGRIKSQHEEESD
ncbi:MAG: ATP-binding cassette domain-containing protein [Clostridiales bacterium]|mgnify:CR=1 FL=1|nr:ATP-binding cassette domain-containing protein [Clostridiales bacterium]